MWIIASVVLAYLLGSIPVSLIIGKRVRGIDLRDLGSGNLGTTNVYRNLGASWGGLCLLLDMAKGALAVFLTTLAVDLVPSGDPMPFHLAGDVYRIMASAAAILGHSFSPFASFRGGKGIATTFGVFLILEPFGVLAAFGVFLAVFFATRIVSLGSICAAAVFPWTVLFFEWRSPHQLSVTLVTFCFVLSTLIVWRHRANIKRLQTGTEQQLSGPDETDGLDAARDAADQTLRDITADTEPASREEGPS